MTGEPFNDGDFSRARREASEAGFSIAHDAVWIYRFGQSSPVARINLKINRPPYWDRLLRLTYEGRSKLIRIDVHLNDPERTLERSLDHIEYLPERSQHVVKFSREVYRGTVAAGEGLGEIQEWEVISAD